MSSRISTRGWETLVFRVATGVVLLHALDAFLNRQPGVPLGQHAPAAAVALVVGLAAAWAFPRLRPGLRAGVSLLFGILAAVNGGTHVAHVAVAEPEGSDLTGLLALGAGVVLIGLGLALPFLHRGEGATTAGRRWANRAIAVAGGAAVLLLGVLPVSFAVVQTHKHREPIGAPPGPAYRPVTFEASDGLRMSGWYVRSRSRAAVIVVHGGGGDRMGALRTQTSSPATATASWSTTRAAAARARAATTQRAGAGTRTSPARSRTCAGGRTSTAPGSALSGSRQAPWC